LDDELNRRQVADGIRTEEAIVELTGTLDKVVREHLVSDVPLGAFLSGGIDSSTVVASTVRHVPRLEMFTIGFDAVSFDESGIARQVARALGTTHHEEILSPQVALELVERVPDLLDESLGDASILPTYLLSRFTRQGVTVALSGDGEANCSQDILPIKRPVWHGPTGTSLAGFWNV
jgi:asparagine synthase (glutamine-hydrolysing)